MQQNLLNLLVIAMIRNWRTTRQKCIVLESCLWCFECMLLALPPQSDNCRVFSVQLLKSTRYLNTVVKLMSRLEEDESKGLSQAMITSLQRGALMNVALLIRNEAALNALGSDDNFVKGLVDVCLIVGARERLSLILFLSLSLSLSLSHTHTHTHSTHTTTTA